MFAGRLVLATAAAMSSAWVTTLTTALELTGVVRE